MLLLTGGRRDDLSTADGLLALVGRLEQRQRLHPLQSHTTTRTIHPFFLFSELLHVHYLLISFYIMDSLPLIISYGKAKLKVWFRLASVFKGALTLHEVFVLRV